VAEYPPAETGRQLAEFPPGTEIGGYRLEGRIGAGGMATVFRARDETLDRTVALKLLTPLLTADAGFRERFIRESRAASVVDHPNIIPIYGAGEDAGVLYLAMRYVSGGDLHSVVEREGPLPPERVVALISPIASALDAAHRAGIVHRDIKPANVLVDMSPGRPDHPYLSDFGLAKRDTTTTLTSAGEFIGTAGFAAPEQIDGRPARFESDQYALACVVFTLLTRRLPFRSSSPEAVLWAQMSQPPPRVTPTRPELPAAVDEVLAQALAKNPADRFPDCATFIGTLDRVLAGGPPAGRTASRTPPVPDGADPGHPSFPLPARNVPPPKAAPRRHRGRGRGTRIAAIGGAVVLVAAAAAAATILLVKPGLLQSVFPSLTRSAPSGPKVTAKLAATLRDPSGQSADSAAFGPGGTLRIVDKDAESAYTFALASQRVTGHNDLGVLVSNGGLLTPDAQSVVSPSSGCLPGGLGPCTYQVFQYNGQGWDVDTPAGSGSPVAVGESSMAITTGTGDTIQVWNLQTLAPVATVTEADDHSPGSIALSPDGGTVAAVSSATGTTHPAYVWNVTSAAAPAVLSIPGDLGVNRTSQNNQSRLPLAVAGSTLAASDGQTTDVYHLGTQQPVTSVPADLLALSPDGQLVATSDQLSPSTTDLRGAATGQIAASLAAPGEQDPPTSVDFSADGRSVAVSYEDGLTRVWRISESQAGS
jgi:serine/threonine-protein kinase